MTILCEPDAQLASALAALVGGDVRTVADLGAATAELDAHPRESLLILGAGLDLHSALPFVAARRNANPALVVFLLHDAPEAVLARAGEAGVTDVFAADDCDGLRAACLRLGPPQRERTRGQVVTVFAAKDGSGKTTFASNLATILHDGGARRVCLLDLDLEFGDLGSALRISPKRTLADARHLPGPVDLGGITQLTTTLAPGLDAILAPVVAGQAVKIAVPLVERLLDELPAAYDHVIVDTPAQFSPYVLAALDRSTHRVLVATPESPTLKSLRELLDTLDLLSYDRAMRSLVVNRYSRDGLSQASVEKALKGRVACWIPSSDDVPVSINQGRPLAISQPDHPVSQAIRRFAASRLLAVQPGCVNPSGPV
ncbi:MAG TPA: P-loop NTPase [Jatrophihabitantaceae bacterium]